MSTPTIQPAQRRGATGQCLRITHGSTTLEIDTSVEGGHVEAVHVEPSPDGNGRVYHRWSGSLSKAVRMLLAASNAAHVLSKARDGA